MATYHKQAEGKGLSLQFDIKEITQEWWLGDPTRIGQVLNNLVSNALKFTERGKVKVSVKDKVIGDRRYLLFACIDTGPGLSAEQQKRLFNKFEQADNSTTRRYGGTGLGLSICKSLVELMHGKIEVASKLGEGSEFHFQIPASFGEAAPENVEKSLHVPDFTGFNVLVAEDNAINQEILQHMLEPTNIAVKIVENGKLALESVKALSPI